MDKKLTVFVLGLGLVAFVLQLIGFSTQGWLVLREYYSVTDEQNVSNAESLLHLLLQNGADKQIDRKKASTLLQMRQKIVSEAEQPMTRARPIRPTLTDGAGVSVDPNQSSMVNGELTNKAESDSDHPRTPAESNTATPRLPLDNGPDGSDISTPPIPRDDGGVPIPDGSDITKPRIPIDDGGVPIPDGSDTAKPRIPIVNGGLPLMEESGARSHITSDNNALTSDTARTRRDVDNIGVGVRPDDSGIQNRQANRTNPANMAGFGNINVPGSMAATTKTGSGKISIPFQPTGNPSLNDSPRSGNETVPNIPGGTPSKTESSGSGKIMLPNKQGGNPTDTPGGGKVTFPNKPGRNPSSTESPGSRKVTLPNKPEGNPPDSPGVGNVTFPYKPGGNPGPTDSPGGGKVTLPNKPGGNPPDSPGSGKVTFPNKPGGNPSSTESPGIVKETLPNKPGRNPPESPGSGKVTFPNKPGDNPNSTDRSGSGEITLPNKPGENPTDRPGGGKVTFPNNPGGNPSQSDSPSGGKVTLPNKPGRTPSPTDSTGSGKVTLPNKPGGKPTDRPGGGKVKFPNKPGGSPRPNDGPSGGKVTLPNKPEGNPGPSESPATREITFPNNPGDTFSTINVTLPSTGTTNSLQQGISLNWKLSLGIWFCNLCVEKECEPVSLTDAIILMQRSFPHLTDDVSISTWNDLKLESVFALVFCGFGLLGSVFLAKPFCLQIRRRYLLMLAVGGLVISFCITRISNINVHISEVFNRGKRATQIDTPWSVVLSGIGAGLAFASVLVLGLGTWRDERKHWKKFETDVDLTKTDSGEDNYADIGQIPIENKTYEPSLESRNV